MIHAFIQASMERVVVHTQSCNCAQAICIVTTSCSGEETEVELALGMCLQKLLGYIC